MQSYIYARAHLPAQILIFLFIATVLFVRFFSWRPPPLINLTV